MQASIVRYGGFLGLGAVVGLFSGLFGVGGGIIMVPALVLVAGYTQHMAQGISLGAMVFTAIAGAFRYFKGGNLDLTVAALLALGSIPSALFAAEMAQRLPQSTLKALFALFIIAMAVRIMPCSSVRSMSLLVGMTFVAVGVRLMTAR